MEETKKKGFDTSSNSYTITYAVVIAVVVAFLLAFISSSLKERQDENVALDKKKQILASLNVRNVDNDEASALYDKMIVADRVIDEDGNVTAEGSKGGTKDGFRCNGASLKEGKLALYVCDVDGQTKYVIPVYGMGLWGGISGYIALNEDRQTVFGAYFNHESETAGLGAEIKDSRAWQDQFKGKRVFAEGKDGIALSVVKKSDIKDTATECEAVTGATLTSVGVSDMLGDCLSKYTNFLTKKQ